MVAAFRKIFWGYLITLIDIHIIIFDFFPDPIGFWLIYSGISQITEELSVGKGAKFAAMAFIFTSVPTVFIRVETTPFSLSGSYQFSGWTIYLLIYHLLIIILIYYLFQVFIELTNKYKLENLQSSSITISAGYIFILLFGELLNSFSMNFNSLIGLQIFVT